VAAATVRFAVNLTPRGGADRVDGVIDGVLRARVSAPPVDEAANEALIRLLARQLDVPRSMVRVAGGRASRRKTIEVEGCDAEAVRRRWPGLAV